MKEHLQLFGKQMSTDECLEEEWRFEDQRRS